MAIARRRATSAIATNVARIPTRSATAAEHRADDEAEYREAEHGAERLTAPLALDAHRDPREGGGPGGRARDPLREAGQAERERASRECEGEAREGEHRETREDTAFRPDPSDQEASRDSPDERAAAVRPEQEARFELRQVVAIDEVGEKRDDRPEQHRVEKHDGPGGGDDPAHPARICRPPPNRSPTPGKRTGP